MAAKSQSLDFDMCDAFVALAPHLDPQQLEDAIATVETLKDDYHRQMALAPLYSHLEESARTEKAVALYPKLTSKQHSSELHVRYWPLLPPDIRHAAILKALDDAIIMKMQPYATAEYLLRIIPWLSALSSDELCRWLLKWMMVAQPATSGEQLERLQSLELEEAIEEVAILANKLALQGFPRLYNSAERSFLVTGAIQYLPEGSQSDAIASWLNRLYESNKPENQAGGLAGLAPYLEGEVRKRAIVDAWSAAQQIESPDKRALLMTMIARQMPGEQQPEKMREALRSLGNYRYMSASKAILHALPSFPQWGVKLILEQEYRFSQHIDDDLYMRIARVAFNPNCLSELIDAAALNKLLDWWMPTCQLSSLPILKHILDGLPEPKRAETIQRIIDRSTAELAPRALAFALRCLLPHLKGEQYQEVLQQLSDAAWHIGEQKEYMHKIAVLYGRPMELAHLVGLDAESSRSKTSIAAFSAMIALAKDTLNGGLSAAYATEFICENLKVMLPHLDNLAADLLLETAEMGLPNYVYWPVASILFSSVSSSKQERIHVLFSSDELILSHRDEPQVVHGSLKARGEALAWQEGSDDADVLNPLLSDMQRLPAKLTLSMLCSCAHEVEDPLRTQFLKSSISMISELSDKSEFKDSVITISTRLPELSPAEEKWLCAQVLTQAAQLRRKELLEVLHNLKPRLERCDMLHAVSETLETIHQQFPSLDDTFKFEI